MPLGASICVWISTESIHGASRGGPSIASGFTFKRHDDIAMEISVYGVDLGHTPYPP